MLLAVPMAFTTVKSANHSNTGTESKSNWKADLTLHIQSQTQQPSLDCDPSGVIARTLYLILCEDQQEADLYLNVSRYSSCLDCK